MNALLAIPSYRRAEYLHQKRTFWYVRELNPHIFVRKEEYEEYCATLDNVYPGWNYKGVKLIPLAEVTDIAQTREAILLYAIKHDYTHLIFLDDDLRIRYIPPSGASRSATHMDMRNFVSDCTRYCNAETPLVSILAQGFANCAKHTQELTYYARRAVYANILHIQTIAKHNISYVWGHPVLEDIYVQCVLRSLGYRTGFITNWTVDSSGREGGCIEQRTVDMQNAAVLALAKKFPRFITIRSKQRIAQRNGDALNAAHLDVTLARN